jgi:hypothetical protein
MSTFMWEQHHSATSTLVLNQRFFTQETRWQASVEQFSCLGIDGGDSASIGRIISARGACSKIVGSGVAFELLPTKLVLELAQLCRCGILGSEGGLLELMITHVCGGKLVELACVLRDSMDEQDNDLVCGVEGLFGVIWGWLKNSIYLEYNFVTSSICSCTLVLM